MALETEGSNPSAHPTLVYSFSFPAPLAQRIEHLIFFTYAIIAVMLVFIQYLIGPSLVSLIMGIK